MQWRASTEAEKQKHKATCLRRRPHNEQKALDLDNTSKQGPLSDPYYFGTPSSRSLLSFWDLLLDSPVGRVQEIAPNPPPVISAVLRIHRRDSKKFQEPIFSYTITVLKRTENNRLQNHQFFIGSSMKRISSFKNNLNLIWCFFRVVPFLVTGKFIVT
jgi:hypothetical protein